MYVLGWLYIALHRSITARRMAASSWKCPKHFGGALHCYLFMMALFFIDFFWYASIWYLPLGVRSTTAEFEISQFLGSLWGQFIHIVIHGVGMNSIRELVAEPHDFEQNNLVCVSLVSAFKSSEWSLPPETSPQSTYTAQTRQKNSNVWW